MTRVARLGQRYHGAGGTRHAPRLSTLAPRATKEIKAYLAARPDAYVLISGGKDSVVCLDLVRRINPDVQAVFFDSGLEFRQTKQYLTWLTKQWGIPLHVYDAEPSALDVLEASGQWEHGVPKTDNDALHEACILAPLRKAQQEHGTAAIYGLRADEAKNRLMLLSKTNGLVTTRDHRGRVTQTYLAPIWRWSFEEVHGYLDQRRIRPNPIYAELIKRGVPERRARVGLMVDGWALEQGRWSLAMAIDPDLARRVEARLPILSEFR